MKKLKLLFSTLALFVFLNTTSAQQIEQEVISFVESTKVMSDYYSSRIYLVDRVGMGLSMGATQIIPTGGLNNYFTSTTGFNIAIINFRLGRFDIGIQHDSGTMRLRAPLPSSETGHTRDFQIGDRARYSTFLALIGYTLIGSSRFELTPFVCFGGTRIVSDIHRGRDRRRYAEFMFAQESSTIGFGLRSEFQLAQLNLNGFVAPTPLNLRFDVGYNMPFNRFNYTPARGNLFYARMGIVWWWWNDSI